MTTVRPTTSQGENLPVSTVRNARPATLSSGASALIDGVTALRDGAMQLSDGLKQLNEEGFQKLVDAMDGDVEPLLERARALAGISGDYQTYSGLYAAMDGSVKFIYRTEAIG